MSARAWQPRSLHAERMHASCNVHVFHAIVQRCRPLLLQMMTCINTCVLPACMQVICKRLNQLGCILPCEHTSASVAAASLVAQHGGKSLMLADGDIDGCFRGVKSRLKQLYKSEPPVFIQKLPASPGQFVAEHRDFALTLFSREDPPVSCPLSAAAMEGVKSRVNMRGGKNKGSAVGLAPAGGFYLYSSRCRPLQQCFFLYIYIYIYHK